MQKDKIKNLLDFIPLLILTIQTIDLCWTTNTSNTAFLWNHLVGLILLPINYLLFFWRHKIGVLFLGLILIFGLLGILSYNYEISVVTVYHGMDTNKNLPLFYGQPIFIVWLTLHFILSFRHYVGIATRKYWNAIKTNTLAHFD
jgi:glucan phosphoethanolaminetransferase (alkaline phosphatase superfamily)